MRRLEDAGRHCRLTQVNCTDWSGWKPFFDSLAPLPNLSVVILKSLSNGKMNPVPVFTSLETLHRHPRITSVTLAYPESQGKPTKLFKMEALTRLVFAAVLVDYFPPVCPILASHCPNIQSVSFRQATEHAHWGDEDPTDPLGVEDLCFLGCFPRLTDLELDGRIEDAIGWDLSRAISQLRGVSLTLRGDEAEYNEYVARLPEILFQRDHPQLESVYVALDNCAVDGAQPLYEGIVEGRLPALRRLKIVSTEPMTVSPEESHRVPPITPDRDECLGFLQRDGFVTHVCERCTYAEKVRPGRCV